jgi:hypothetical protein
MKETTLKDYSKALKSNDISIITEASIKIISQYIEKKSVKTCGILTARDVNNTQAENVSRNKKLQHELKNLGLGFFKLNVHFKHSSIGDITDMYYVVPNIKLNDITSLMYKFEQSGIIFQDFEKEPYSNAFFDGLLTSSHTPLESIECTGFQWIPSGMFTNLALRSHLNKKT